MKLWPIVVFLFLFSFISVSAIPVVDTGINPDNLPVVLMGNGKSICPDGYVAQNLTKTDKLECVAVNSIINVSNLNFTGANISANLVDYAKLNSSNQPFCDSSNKNSINTQIRSLYNNAGNLLCTWSNALGTGFDCVTLSQNNNTVCDRSGNCNSTYGTNASINETFASVTARGNATTEKITVGSINASNTSQTNYFAGVVGINTSGSNITENLKVNGNVSINAANNFSVVLTINANSTQVADLVQIKNGTTNLITVNRLGNLNVSRNATIGLITDYTNKASINANNRTLYDSAGTVIQANYSLAKAISMGGASAPVADSFYFGIDAGKFATGVTNANFIGSNAGYGASAATYSNFIGYYAGASSSSSQYSNFIGYQTGNGASSSSNSNFIGNYAGQGASSAPQSNFIGYYAGSGSSGSYNSNFLGVNSGSSSTYVTESNFIGDGAGSSSPSNTYVNSIGYYAGAEAYSVQSSNFIGYNAGRGAQYSYYATFIGDYSGYYTSNPSYAVAIGSYANAFNIINPSTSSSGSSYSTKIGNQAGYGNARSEGSTMIGNYAGYSATNPVRNVLLGEFSGGYAQSLADSVCIGAYSCYYDYANNFYSYSVNGLANFYGLNENSCGYSSYTMGDFVEYYIYSYYYDGSQYVFTASPTYTSITVNSGTDCLDMSWDVPSYPFSGIYILRGVTPSGGYATWTEYDYGYTSSINDDGSSNWLYQGYFGYNTGNTYATDYNTVTGSNIAIGRYSGTGGYSNSIAIGHGVINSNTYEMNLGNIIKIQNIYSSDSQSNSLQSGTVDMSQSILYASVMYQNYNTVCDGSNNCGYLYSESDTFNSVMSRGRTFYNTDANNELQIGYSSSQYFAINTSSTGTVTLDVIGTAPNLYFKDNVSLTNGGSLSLTGANTTNPGRIILNATPSGSYDTNLIMLGRDNQTAGFIFGNGTSFVGASGAYFGGRANNYTQVANQKGFLFLSGGSPTTNVGNDGDIAFYTNDTQRMNIDYAGVINITSNLTTDNITVRTKVFLPNATIGTPLLTFTNDNDTGIGKTTDGILHLISNGAVQLTANAGNGYVSTTNIQSGNLYLGSSLQVRLGQDDYDIFAQRYQNNSQAFRIYSKYTSATNFERLVINASNNSNYIIASEANGTGNNYHNLTFKNMTLFKDIYNICDASGNCNSTYNLFNDTLQSVTDRGYVTTNPIEAGVAGYGYAKIGYSGQYGGYFADPSNYVYLTDGNNAINAYGRIYFADSSGGSLTFGSQTLDIQYANTQSNGYALFGSGSSYQTSIGGYSGYGFFTSGQASIQSTLDINCGGSASAYLGVCAGGSYVYIGDGSGAGIWASDGQHVTYTTYNGASIYAYDAYGSNSINLVDTVNNRIINAIGTASVSSGGFNSFLADDIGVNTFGIPSAGEFDVNGQNYAVLSSSSAAGIFTDVASAITKSVSLIDGTYALNVGIGNSNFNGNITLQDTVWDDLQFTLSPSASKIGALSYGDFNNTIIQVPYFKGTVSNTDLSGCQELPHGYKLGTNVSPHLHIAPATAAAGANATLQFTYLWNNLIGGVTKTGQQNITVKLGNLAWNQTSVEFNDISGAGITLGSQFCFNLARLQDHANDSYTGNVFLEQVSIHYESDTIGSDSEWSK